MAGYDTVQMPDTVVSVKADHDFALESSGITFHPSGEAGVFISAPGRHSVRLFDLSGHLIKEAHGEAFPIDYDFSRDLKERRSGVYVMRVAVGNKTAFRKIYAR
jgi:hypothetical protein